ncbi:MAG: glycerol-3-phosphate dehydrogenase/oxidase [Alteromonadaceae bacterium]|nr:glycerol-3-phosphate dehydrogenase/oxidase [Alteromonadaceae bacterium]
MSTDAKQHNKTKRINKISRAQRLANISAQPQWDMIIVGGGITGAGIFKLACQLGLKTLLVEQKDFAWGSSSRSSKMVHGGLRYIAQGQIKLTLESVQEREKLLTQAPHLVTEQSFVMGHYQGQFPWPWIFNSLLWVYNLFAPRSVNNQQQAQRHTQVENNNKGYLPLSINDFSYVVPATKTKNSQGATQFSDAITDDARLVLRLIQEGQQLGGQAINYCQVEHYLFGEVASDKIVGVYAHAETAQQSSKQSAEQKLPNPADPQQTMSLNLKAKVVVNATGAWAGELEVTNKGTKENSKLTNKVSVPAIKIRPLRGSHIIVPSWRLPVASVVVILHPQDKRPVQVFPWQNVTVIGTTDVEHKQGLKNEANISQDELSYLLAAVDFQFPSSKLNHDDIISTYAGVRPVVASNSFISSSKEKRDHSIWQQAGLVTIAGGKLTTFNVIAKQVLTLLSTELGLAHTDFSFPVFDLPRFDDSLIVKEAKKNNLSDHHYQHLLACYGGLVTDFLEKSAKTQLTEISYSRHLWAELVWAIHYEQVQHLDDLLLRRTRLGNVLPNGGVALLGVIKILCTTLLHWSESKWDFEVQRYKKLWKANYSLPLLNKNNNKTALN